MTYKIMARQLFAEVEGSSIKAASSMIVTGKLAQIANGFVYGEGGAPNSAFVHSLKIDWLRELLESLDGEPLLIAYEFIEDLRTVRRVWRGAAARRSDVRHVRRSSSSRIGTQGNCRCSPFHPASAGRGLNLQHGGSRMAWLSPSWSAELTEQAIARVYRPGQTRHGTIHVCIAVRTVDEMKRNRVIGKMCAQEAFQRHLEQI